MEKNRAVLYLRLSKEDHDKISVGDNSVSIINQRMLLTDYALEHEFQVSEVYQDDDFSGFVSLFKIVFDNYNIDGKIKMDNKSVAYIGTIKLS